MDLLAIAGTLSEANPKLAENLEDWFRQVNALLAGNIADDLATEQQLEDLALDLRRQWISLANSVVEGEMRSPSSDHLPLMPVSQSRRFNYERVVHPRQAENKLKQVGPEIPGWQMEVSLFGNGLAAISAVIHAFRSFKEKYLRGDGKRLQLDMFGGYFETLCIFQLLDAADFGCQAFQDQDKVLQRFSNGTTDILFLELIAYDWEQTVIDPAALLEALKARPADRPWILVLDTTLLGPVFDPAPLLSACGERKPLLVLEIRSGLKLDQVGLEFSNVGIIRIFTHEDLDTERYPGSSEVWKELKKLRKILGSGLSYAQMAILDAPWIFHPKWMIQHSQCVLDNNRRMAIALSGIQGLFARVNHPGTGPQRDLSWAESPLVIIEFRSEEDTWENWELLLAVIAHEVRQRKLVFHIGASFGFRHHRCEVIAPEWPYLHPDGSFRGFLKIAMGARYGPSLQGVIELFQELAAFSDFQALRQAYGKLNPARAKAVFPDLNVLRLIK